MDSDGFTIVSRKKSRSTHKKTKPTANHIINTNEDIINDKKLKEKLQHYRDILDSSEFLGMLSDKLKSFDVKELVSYGIGNFASCIIARYQLTLFLALRDKFKLDKNDCHIYDPNFTEQEKEVLTDLDLSLITYNEEGKKRCHNSTFLYMPHCGRPLYNNLLWRNWSEGNLQNVIILGNSFRHMVESTPDRVLEENGQYIKRIFPFTEEIVIPNIFQYADIYNDTSLHFFPSHKLKDIQQNVWEDNTEPVYCGDVEIVTNKN